jgi:hypothetical protein
MKKIIATLLLIAIAYANENVDVFRRKSLTTVRTIIYSIVLAMLRNLSFRSIWGLKYATIPKIPGPFAIL